MAALLARSPLSSAISLLMLFANAVAASGGLTEPSICYVLDGLLFIYGVILTGLYCQLRFEYVRAETAAQDLNKSKGEEGIYTGLAPRAQDTYETIGMKKALQ